MARAYEAFRGGRPGAEIDAMSLKGLLMWLSGKEMDPKISELERRANDARMLKRLDKREFIDTLFKDIRAVEESRRGDRQ
jgi:hypothetical protein